MKKVRGVVTLVFDDGYSHILDNIVPLLRRYKLPAVFAVPLQGANLAASEGLAVAPYSAWLSHQDSGHEIAAHSVSHTDLTTLPPARLEQELAEPAKVLSATTLIYPGGAHNPKVVTAAKQYYQAARTTQRGLEKIVPANPLELRTYNFTRRNFSPLKANLLALVAWLTNRWLIETYHVISDASASPYAISPADFNQHLKFLARLPISVKTIHAHLHN